MFVESALCSNNDTAVYEIDGFQLFRNDVVQNGRRTHGTAIYVKKLYSTYLQPLSCNHNDVEMTLIKADQPVNNLHIVVFYRSTHLR
jgi:hypothetical protein